MFILGIVLVLIGAVVAAVAHRTLGLGIIAVGLILLLVDLLVPASSEAFVPAGLLVVGMVSGPGPGGSQEEHKARRAKGRVTPRRRRTNSQLDEEDEAPQPEPVLLAFLAAAVPVVCAFILQVLDASDALESALWLRALLTGLGPLVGVLTSLWARARVTPLQRPRDSSGRRLT